MAPCSAPGSQRPPSSHPFTFDPHVFLSPPLPACSSLTPLQEHNNGSLFSSWTSTPAKSGNLTLSFHALIRSPLPTYFALTHYRRTTTAPCSAPGPQPPPSQASPPLATKQTSCCRVSRISSPGHNPQSCPSNMWQGGWFKRGPTVVSK